MPMSFEISAGLGGSFWAAEGFVGIFSWAAGCDSGFWAVESFGDAV